MMARASIKTRCQGAALVRRGSKNELYGGYISVTGVVAISITRAWHAAGDDGREAEAAGSANAARTLAELE